MQCTPADPRAPQTSWLSQVFARNAALYGGARMESDAGDKGDAEKGTVEKGSGDAGADKPNGDAEKPNGGAGDQEQLGESGKRALNAEREARKQAEEQAKALRGEFDGFKSALAEALGIKPKEGEKEQDALAAVQEQLAAMQRESSVLKLANEHMITDQKDLELLATAKDADSMRKLAERLAPNQEERDATSRRRVQPDRSQGGNGGGASSSTSVAQVMADRAAARAAKSA